ncbi:hypothetical protein FSP39_000599 [Pinctada imbricata]|uniref:Extradiol ring-cleavage dioxygenase class III enzyme subunit B domain-containing protein n=1 Tax=Pinctada imbricata TaxID=66713 RepID=A0AA89BS12_PINIB|nr:hypothetical protein FSP39_000599 [Pinctada imbricata]
MSKSQPVIFLSHGGGPSYYLSSQDMPIFKGMDKDSTAAQYLQNLSRNAGLSKPDAIVVLSAHWEEPVCSVLSNPRPSLYFDYEGFPPETYKLTWPVPGSPQVANKVEGLLQGEGIRTRQEKSRGLDHGVFVPLKLAFPDADIPVLQVSLLQNLDMKDHLAIAEALSPLSAENILLVGSGFTTHGGMWKWETKPQPWLLHYQTWLHDVLFNPSYSAKERKDKILKYSSVPNFQKAHKRIEHFLPMMMASAAANYRPGKVIFSEFLGDTMLNEHYLFPPE